MASPVAWDAWQMANRAVRRFIPMSSSSVLNLAGFFEADTLAQLRAIASDDVNRVCILAGNVSAGDGGGGVYTWYGLANDADDPMLVIRPNDYAGAGVWKQLL